jgi:hypothetical protein
VNGTRKQTKQDTNKLTLLAFKIIANTEDTNKLTFLAFKLIANGDYFEGQ